MNLVWGVGMNVLAEKCCLWIQPQSTVAWMSLAALRTRVTVPLNSSPWSQATVASGPLRSNSSSACAVPVAGMALRNGARNTPCSPLQWRTLSLLPAQLSNDALHSSRARRNPPSRSQHAALPTLAVVNFDFANPSLVLGSLLIVCCGMLLLQLRRLPSQVVADIVSAAMVFTTGSTFIIIQALQLETLPLLFQAVIASFVFWCSLGALRHTKEAQRQQQQQAVPSPSCTEDALGELPPCLQHPPVKLWNAVPRPTWSFCLLCSHCYSYHAASE